MSLILNEFKRSCVLSKNGIIFWPLFTSMRHNLKRRHKEPVRKPIWTPMAPSKLFRIRVDPVFTPEEQQQRDHLTKTYTTTMRSIEDFLCHEFYSPTLSSGGLSEDQVNNEEINQKALIEDNDRENERIARQRDERMKKIHELMDQKRIVEYLTQSEQMRQKGKQLDQMVRQEVKRSDTYITRETIDEAIDEALCHPITYDFSIDFEGNVYSDQPLHPYALRPNDIPDDCSNMKELSHMPQMPIKLDPKTIY